MNIKIKKFIFLKKKIRYYLSLMRFNNITGFFLLLWPTLSTIFFSIKKLPDIKYLVIFSCGAILMRSIGCIINDYIDCDIDSKVSRTMLRPLSTGRITKKESIFLLGILLLFSLLLIYFFLTEINIYLCLLALILIFLYPFMKRYTYFPQVFLAIVFNFSILITWSFFKYTFLSKECLLLFIAHFFWTISYDTQYAIMDMEDDKKIGIKSTAIFFEKFHKLTIIILQILSLITFIFFGKIINANYSYYFFMFLLIMVFIYQYNLMNKKKYLQAFLSNNYIGFLLFLNSIFSTSIIDITKIIFHITNKFLI